jgi:hypothetical protein
LGEVLRKKWNLPDVSQSSSEKEEEIQKGGSRLIFGGGDEDISSVAESVEEGEKTFQLRFCLFTINTQAIVPFLCFWLVSEQKEGQLGFPETVFSPSSDENAGTGTEEEEEEEHAEFLDSCRKKFLEMGIFKEEQEDNFTTERMEENYHGYIVSPDEKNVVYVFYNLSPPSGVMGKWGLLDEILNRGEVLGTPVDTRIRPLFYANHELLYIYGSPVNPMDALFYGTETKYDSSNESAQEIPYCLYLCQDKAEFSEDVQEGKAVETTTGKLFGLEEGHYLSPKDKYRSAKKEDRQKSILRTEDEHGYFYYFMNELLEDGNEDVERYAVFVYNTDYRLDESTLNILKSLDIEKRLVGGEYWKTDYSLEKWVGGGIFDFFKRFTTQEKGAMDESVREGQEDEDEGEDEEEGEEGEEEDDTVYASIYFQRDGIPLWCIKNKICFTTFE